MACYQRARRADQSSAEIRRANLWAKYQITPSNMTLYGPSGIIAAGICGINEAGVDLKRVLP
jgi:hypothetical protein